MSAVPEKEILRPPGLITVLRKGFDITTNHIGLILFPAALDLFIWLGPHFHIKPLLTTFFSEIQASLASLPSDIASQSGPWNNPDMQQMMKDLQAYLVEHFNLLTFLRSFPVGIPSFMSGRLPVGTPLPGYLAIEVSDPAEFLGLVIVLSILGLAIGNLFYQLVAQAALQNKLDIATALGRWPRQALHTLGLGVFYFLLSIAAFVPFFCLSLVTFGALGSLSAILYVGLLVVVLYPFIFAGHAIAANGENLLAALRSSARLARLTLPMTSLFLLTVFLLTRALEAVWIVPAEDSWLTLIAIAGHAFATTGFLAATFVYYRDAGRWVDALLRALA